MGQVSKKEDEDERRNASAFIRHAPIDRFNLRDFPNTAKKRDKPTIDDLFRRYVLASEALDAHYEECSKQRSVAPKIPFRLRYSQVIKSLKLGFAMVAAMEHLRDALPSGPEKRDLNRTLKEIEKIRSETFRISDHR